MARLWTAALLTALACASATAFAAIAVEDWGQTRSGHAVQRTTLANERGMRLSYIDYGATITSIEVPDRRGAWRNVMLSLPALAAYETTQRRFGAVIGRYAGRIGKARFTMDGRAIQLTPNAKGVALHGDPDGYDKRVWKRRDFADADSIGSTFHLDSPDGDQGFPGRMAVRVTYRLLRKRNEFRIEYAAATSAPTVVNLTNHGYFNLAGAGAAGLASHRFQIHADRYAVTDALRVPTGELAGVAGTPLDFRQAASATGRQGGDFDHSLVFAKPAGVLALVATIDEAHSGIRMQVSTSEPSVQFNTGTGFDGGESGSEGIAYRRHAGFALETQHLPDSPNHAHFPTTVVTPGTPFTSVSRFRFSIAP